MSNECRNLDLGSLFFQYKSRKLPHLRRGKDYEAAILNFIDGWERCTLSELAHADIIERLDTIAIDRPALANRTLSYMKAFLTWAFSRGLIDRNPLMGVARPAIELPRNRWLSASELRLLWNVLDEFGYPFGTATKLLILTAGRNSEVSRLENREFIYSTNGSPDVWEIPPVRSKTRAAFRIPLSQQAQSVICLAKGLSGHPDSPYLFTTTGRTPISGWSRFKRNLDAQLRKKSFGIPGLFDEAWRLHDVRRSFATIAIDELDVEFVVADRCLNHCASGSMSVVARVYAKAEMFEKRKIALQKWADFICS